MRCVRLKSMNDWISSRFTASACESALNAPAVINQLRGLLLEREATFSAGLRALAEWLPEVIAKVAQWNFDFLGAPGRVGQGLGDVFAFQVGVLAENLVRCAPSGNEADNRADRDAHSADTRLSAHDGGIPSDAC
jgi:hypothetical protein